MILIPELGEQRWRPDSKAKPLMDNVLSDSTARQMAEIFKVLGDSTRIKIVQALSRKTLCVCDISSLLGISQSAVSHQLRVLRNLRIARGQKRGRRVFYSLSDEHVKRLFSELLQHVRE